MKQRAPAPEETCTIVPKKDPSQEALRELRAMERDEPSPEGVARLRTLIAHRSGYVVGRAAKLAGEWQAGGLIPELLAAFERFLQDPAKQDPGCAAKQAIIGALVALAHNDPEIFLRASRYVQREPGYVGDNPDAWKARPLRRVWEDIEPSRDDDTAATLRGMAGDGLLGCHYSEAYHVVAGLLMDKEARTRRVAMETLAGAPSEQSELLIRMALLAGEPEPDIFNLGLQGLMAINGERSLEFVAGFLDSPELPVAEGAALAIGEARLPESFPMLRRAWNSHRWTADRAALALPIALTRDDGACAFLMDVIRDGREQLAGAALKALSIYASQPERVAEIRAAVDARGSRELAQLFNQVFEA